MKTRQPQQPLSVKEEAVLSGGGAKTATKGARAVRIASDSDVKKAMDHVFARHGAALRKLA